MCADVLTLQTADLTVQVDVASRVLDPHVIETVQVRGALGY